MQCKILKYVRESKLGILQCRKPLVDCDSGGRSLGPTAQERSNVFRKATLMKELLDKIVEFGEDDKTKLRAYEAARSCAQHKNS